MIIKGTISVQAIKDELGNVPVNLKTCYDGDYVGELAHFEISESLTQEMVDVLNRQRTTCVTMEECLVLEINKGESNRIINKGM